MSRGGFSFGDHALYRRRAYYRSWIYRTLLTAWKLPIDCGLRHIIMQLNSKVEPPKVVDPGMPCVSLQRHGMICQRESKTSCLLVMIINLIQVWHSCSKEHPKCVEDSLIELDRVIEEWEREEVVGSIGTGFKLEVK